MKIYNPWEKKSWDLSLNSQQKNFCIIDSIYLEKTIGYKFYFILLDIIIQFEFHFKYLLIFNYFLLLCELFIWPGFRFSRLYSFFSTTYYKRILCIASAITLSLDFGLCTLLFVFDTDIAHSIAVIFVQMRLALSLMSFGILFWDTKYGKPLGFKFLAGNFIDLEMR